MSDTESKIRDLQESWSKIKSDVLKNQNCPICGQPMKYHENSDGKGFWTCQKCNLIVKESVMAYFHILSWEKMARFFVHGIAFSGLFFVLEIVWLFAGAFLVFLAVI